MSSERVSNTHGYFGSVIKPPQSGTHWSNHSEARRMLVTFAHTGRTSIVTSAVFYRCREYPDSCRRAVSSPIQPWLRWHGLKSIFFFEKSVCGNMPNYENIGIIDKLVDLCWLCNSIGLASYEVNRPHVEQFFGWIGRICCLNIIFLEVWANVSIFRWITLYGILCKCKSCRSYLWWDRLERSGLPRFQLRETIDRFGSTRICLSWHLNHTFTLTISSILS